MSLCALPHPLYPLCRPQRFDHAFPITLCAWLFIVKLLQSASSPPLVLTVLRARTRQEPLLPAGPRRRAQWLRRPRHSPDNRRRTVASVSANRLVPRPRRAVTRSATSASPRTCSLAPPAQYAPPTSPSRRCSPTRLRPRHGCTVQTRPVRLRPLWRGMRPTPQRRPSPTWRRNNKNKKNNYTHRPRPPRLLPLLQIPTLILTLTWASSPRRSPRRCRHAAPHLHRCFAPASMRNHRRRQHRLFAACAPRRYITPPSANNLRRTCSPITITAVSHSTIIITHLC